MRNTCLGCLAVLLLLGFVAGCGSGGSTGSSIDEQAMLTLEPEPAEGVISTLSLVPSTVTLHSVADTFINQAARDTNYGGQSNMAAGNYWGGSRRFSMVRFDLSAVPVNATVSGAVLKLYMFRDYQSPGTYTVYRIRTPWSEAGAIWATHSKAYRQVPPAGSTVIQPTMLDSYVDFDVRDLARSWVATPGRNYGCLVRPIEGNELVGVQFATREYVGRDPLLVLTYLTPPAGPPPVDLGTAGKYVILAKAAISTTGTTAVVGNIGLSPAARSYITGFSETLDSTNVFATAPIVTGRLFAADMAPPTPSNMTTAVSNMETAYTDAAGRPTPDFTELYGGDISGRVLVPGLYKWGTSLLINSDVTLKGGPNDVWIFQIAGDLTMAAAKTVILKNGALPKNIFWQVAGQAILGTTSDFKGVILCKTQIVLQTGAVMNGRALAQTAVTLDANAVTQPAP